MTDHCWFVVRDLPQHINIPVYRLFFEILKKKSAHTILTSIFFVLDIKLSLNMDVHSILLYVPAFKVFFFFFRKECILSK